MVTIKPLSEIRAKYEAAASRVSEPYKAGILRNQNWQQNAVSTAAETNYAIKVQAAITAKRRQTKLAKVSQSTWQQAASTDGAAKIGQAMGLAADKQIAGFTKYHAFLASLNLPPRTTDPAQNVTNRVLPVATGLANLKKSSA